MFTRVTISQGLWGLSMIVVLRVAVHSWPQISAQTLPLPQVTQVPCTYLPVSSYYCSDTCLSPCPMNSLSPFAASWCLTSVRLTCLYLSASWPLSTGKNLKAWAACHSLILTGPKFSAGVWSGSFTSTIGSLGSCCICLSAKNFFAGSAPCPSPCNATFIMPKCVLLSAVDWLK